MLLIYVNGRFLERPVTGVERFAIGLLRRIDAALVSLPIEERQMWRIVAPRSVSRPAYLKAIEFVNVGRLGGHAWEQTELFWGTRTGILVNLCNSGPVLHSRQLTVIHDAAPYRFPRDYPFTYGLLHRSLGRLLARRARLATVSEFSRRELSDVFALAPKEIAVIPNAGDHIGDLVPDATVLDRLGLAGKRFLLFVGSPAPNKNLKRAAAAFQALGSTDLSLVVVGAAARSNIAHGVEGMPANVVLAGRLADPEVAGLYAAASALVFPSLYEGFGIPPLEAMRHGCLVLAADIPPVREVCGTSAVYFEPTSVDSIVASYRRVLQRDPELNAVAASGPGRAALFSWRHSADMLMKQVDNVIQAPKRCL